MSSFTCAVLRPGGGNPAFMLCKPTICSYYQEPWVQYAILAEHSTRNTGSWRIESDSRLSVPEFQAIAPGSQVCEWLRPSKLVLVCERDPTKRYRICGLLKKPQTMPTRSYDLEIALHETVARRNHPEAAFVQIPEDAEGHLRLQQAQDRLSFGACWFTHHELTRSIDDNRLAIAQTSENRALDTSRFTEAIQRGWVIPSRQPAPLYDHVAKILVKDARTSNNTCPITFDSFKEITRFSVPVCGHVCSELTTTLTQCPVCRTPTSWTLVELPLEAN